MRSERAASAACEPLTLIAHSRRRKAFLLRLLPARRELLLDFARDALQPTFGPLGALLVGPDVGLKPRNPVLGDPQLHRGLMRDCDCVLGVLLGNAGCALQLDQNVLPRPVQRIVAIRELDDLLTHLHNSTNTRQHAIRKSDYRAADKKIFRLLLSC